MTDLRAEYARELEHWKLAIRRLSDPDVVAPPQAWEALEHYLGIALRQMLSTVVARLRTIAGDFEAFLRTAPAGTGVEQFQGRLVSVRRAYLKAETTVDFYSDVLASRANPRVAPLLRSCDQIATRSMAEALLPLGRQVPAVLSYIDKGIGASVLKAGLRLWDGTADNVICSIKVTRHALVRSAAVLHEGGHQVAHMLGWNQELAAALVDGLGRGDVASEWAYWSSEISADAFAHVHAGFAAAAALHDVLDDTDAVVFHFLPRGDVHPPGWVRVQLVLAMCRRSFGAGPWDALEDIWRQKHRIEHCPPDVRPFMQEAVRVIPQVVEILLYKGYRAFGGRSLTGLINPARVSPAALDQLKRDAGNAALASPYWAWNESVRLLALNGYKAGVGAEELRQALNEHEAWMLRHGASRLAA